MQAFDLAEELQTPIFVLLDLDLGMNYWMSEPFPYPKKPFKRGKVLTAADIDRLGGFARYKDVDGDGICYRALPGAEHPRAAYFTRGSGHNENAGYSERPDDYMRNMDRLNRKFETARRMMPPPAVDYAKGARVGLIAAGTTHWAVVESREQLRQESDIENSYLRIRAFPFNHELGEFISRHDRVYVIEQNRDAQLFDLIRLELPSDLHATLRSVRYYGGLPIDARTITDEIAHQEGL
jgi:2-oxoglutarate ferredoxin oxidoreductase subunit alpha